MSLRRRSIVVPNGTEEDVPPAPLSLQYRSGRQKRSSSVGPWSRLKKSNDNGGASENRKSLYHRLLRSAKQITLSKAVRLREKAGSDKNDSNDDGNNLRRCNSDGGDHISSDSFEKWHRNGQNQGYKTEEMHTSIGQKKKPVVAWKTPKKCEKAATPPGNAKFNWGLPYSLKNESSGSPSIHFNSLHGSSSSNRLDVSSSSNGRREGMRGSSSSNRSDGLPSISLRQELTSMRLWDFLSPRAEGPSIKELRRTRQGKLDDKYGQRRSLSLHGKPLTGLNSTGHMSPVFGCEHGSRASALPSRESDETGVPLDHRLSMRNLELAMARPEHDTIRDLFKMASASDWSNSEVDAPPLKGIFDSLIAIENDI